MSVEILYFQRWLIKQKNLVIFNYCKQSSQEVRIDYYTILNLLVDWNNMKCQGLIKKLQYEWVISIIMRFGSLTENKIRKTCNGYFAYQIVIPRKLIRCDWEDS